jgi:predicted nucleic acid-binding protein
MSDNKRVFIDTNILVYRSFGTVNQKEKIQKLLIEHSGSTYISVQVLNEFINTSLKKKLFKSEALLAETLAYFIGSFQVVPIATDTVLKANFIRERYRLAYYDSVIVAAALENECEVLYSEDMHHYATFEKKLKVVNPFR